MRHSSLAHLPNAFFAMVPELATLDFPTETRTTCSSCPISVPTAQRSIEQPFNIDTTCCTFHPTLRNYAAGFALERGGTSARVLRRRLQDPRMVTALAIEPPKVWDEGYAAGKSEIFGKDPHYLCPYYVSGEHPCGIWRDRNAVCRTWFCKHNDGDRSGVLWHRAKIVIGRIEQRLALWCTLVGQAPKKDVWHDPKIMEAWYLECAGFVRDAHPSVVSKMRDESLEKYVTDMSSAARALMPDLPDTVCPRIANVHKNDDGTYLLSGKRQLDYLHAPADVFELISRLNSETPWRDALQESAEHMQEPLDASFIERLFRMTLAEKVVAHHTEVSSGMTLNLRQTKPDGSVHFMQAEHLERTDVPLFKDEP